MSITNEKSSTRAMTESLNVEQLAQEFQEVARQIKSLEARAKPLKQLLIAYAQEHRERFDEAFQIKFPNGTYVALRVRDCIDGTDESKRQFIEKTGEEYAKIELDEKQILSELPKNEHLKKLCTMLNLTVAQKEVLAVYAG